MSDLTNHFDAGTGGLTELARPKVGYMYEGRVARVHQPGDPLRYSWGEEHRDAAELANIVAQLPGKPVVSPPDEHVHHPIDLLKVGAPHKVVGKVVSARVDGDYAVAEIFIHDEGTIAEIKKGTDQLSLGYACRADSAKFQRNTYVDHLAVVERARCGATCALRADGANEGGCACSATDAGRFQEPVQGTPCTCHAEGHTDRVGMSVAATEHADGKLNAAARHALPSSDFADPATKQEPLEDEGHVRAAMSRFAQTNFPGPAARKSAFHRIVARAHELGIDPADFEKKYAGRLDHEDMTMDLQKQIETLQAENTALKTRAEKAEQTATAEKSRADGLEAERDNARSDAKAEKTRADKAASDLEASKTDARKDADERMDAAVAEKVSLLVKANEILGATDDKGQPVDRIKMSTRDLKVAMIKHVDETDVPADKSADYVEALFTGAVARHAKNTGSHANFRAATHAPRQNAAAAVVAARKDANDSEAAAIAAMHDGYRKPTKNKK